MTTLTSPTDRVELLRSLGRQFPPDLSVGGRRRKGGVSRGPEIDRVLSLPLRALAGYPDSDRAAAQEALERPGAPDPRMRLWPVQADALLAAADLARANPDPVTGRRAGLLGAIFVGGGKTLTAALLGTVWGCRRPLILTDASLVPQTRRLVSQYRRHFLIPDFLQVLAYSTLSTAGQEDVLEAYAPDALICDEAANLKNAKSARGRRLRRFLKKHPEVRLAMLTGTVIRKSLRDLATIAAMALWHWSPLPRDYQTQVEWAEALDPEPIREVGALRVLAPGASDAAEVRAGMAGRLARSPGVVVSSADEVDVPLEVEVFATERDPAVEAALDDLKRTWCRPDGEELALATEMAEVSRQIRLGGYYAWTTEPDREWLQARSAWRRAAREWIAEHPGSEDLRIDSELALERAVIQGLIDGEAADAFDEWAAIRDRSREPPKEWRWIGQAVVEQIAEEVAARPQACFVRRIGFARRLADLARVVYFESGDDPAGLSGSRSVVLALDSFKKGLNLQHAYSVACAVDPSPTAADWQQLAGRLHRPGQLAEKVLYRVPDLFQDELRRATVEAEWLASAQGQGQKLLQAEIRWLDAPAARAQGGGDR